MENVVISFTVFIKLAIASAIVAGACYLTWLVTDSKWQSKYDKQASEYSDASAKAQQSARDTEHEYQTKLDAANLEASTRRVETANAIAGANAATKRLLTRLNKVLADTSTSDTGTGQRGRTPEQAINLLANVLEKSIERNGQLATFADQSWDASKQCYDSYNAVRGSTK